MVVEGGVGLQKLKGNMRTFLKCQSRERESGANIEVWDRLPDDLERERERDRERQKRVVRAADRRV